jgi:lactate dehydrogenase-like 2-hydroxyacid dehydrogenase
MKPKVLIPLRLKRYEKVRQILEPLADIEYVERADTQTYDELLPTLEAMVGGRINEDTLRRAPKLRVVARWGVGYDDCDVEAMTRYRVYLCHTPGVLSDAVADMALALLLACTRRVLQADKYVREGWAERAPGGPTYGVDLKGKTLGIAGLGRIGYEMAKRCVKGFDMQLIYYDIYRNKRAEEELGAEPKTLEEVMRESDFISVHLALTPETRGIIGERQLRMMKSTAYIINTSRGRTVDQEALTRILSENAIAGAGLDVFEKEPIPLDEPLLKLSNVVLAPHIASATEETREAMAVCDAVNIAAVLQGELPPPNVVPEQRGMIFD